MEKFDIIIIGAGIAGLSSAYTSIKNGLRTALVDKQDYSGGIAKDCFHTYICGLFKNDATNPFQIANKGICSDVYNFLYNRYGDKCLVRLGKVETLAFKQKDLWNFFTDSLNQIELNQDKKSKVKFTFFKNTNCIEVFHKDKKIQKIMLSSKTNSFYLKADAFINATGSDALTANDEKLNSSLSHTQLGGYCMLLEGESDIDLPLLVPYTARKIVKKYNLNDYLKYITITYNFLTEQHILKFSVLTPDDISQCKFIFKKLKKKIDTLSGFKFIKSSEKIHLRTCNQTYSIDKSFQSQTNQEYSNCVKSYWPVEEWIKNKGPKYEYLKDNKPFVIFNSALKDYKFNNLFLAGKSIRVSERVHSSARVMGVSMATGEKASINAFKFLKEN